MNGKRKWQMRIKDLTIKRIEELTIKRIEELTIKRIEELTIKRIEELTTKRKCNLIQLVNERKIENWILVWENN